MAALRAEQDLLTRLSERERIQESLIVAEFTSLRSEILQRVQFQHLTIGLALTFAGALLTYASSDKVSVSGDILWGYPLLAFGLAIMWSFDNMRIVQISEYICADVEALLTHRPPFGWQHFLASDRCHTPLFKCRLSGITAAMMIFLCVPLFVVAASVLLQDDWNRSDTAYLSMDGVTIVLTVALVWISDRRPTKRARARGAAQRRL
jgi:hypothetical protein